MSDLHTAIGAHVVVNELEIAPEGSETLEAFYDYMRSESHRRSHARIPTEL